MSEPTFEGGCLCGSVRYRITGAPLSSSVCHCRSCRLASGAPSVAWFVVALEQFELREGELSTYRSSTHVTRAFCARCGAQISYRHDDSPQRIELTTATLDEPSVFPPSREIWHSQKVEWAGENRELVHYLYEAPAGSDSS